METINLTPLGNVKGKVYSLPPHSVLGDPAGHNYSLSLQYLRGFGVRKNSLYRIDTLGIVALSNTGRRF